MSAFVRIYFKYSLICLNKAPPPTSIFLKNPKKLRSPRGGLSAFVKIYFKSSLICLEKSPSYNFNFSIKNHLTLKNLKKSKGGNCKHRKNRKKNRFRVVKVSCQLTEQSSQPFEAIVDQGYFINNVFIKDDFAKPPCL